jgi:hypothetical protein
LITALEQDLLRERIEAGRGQRDPLQVQRDIAAERRVAKRELLGTRLLEPRFEEHRLRRRRQAPTTFVDQALAELDCDLLASRPRIAGHHLDVDATRGKRELGRQKRLAGADDDRPMVTRERDGRGESNRDHVSRADLRVRSQAKDLHFGHQRIRGPFGPTIRLRERDERQGEDQGCPVVRTEGGMNRGA